MLIGDRFPGAPLTVEAAVFSKATERAYLFYGTYNLKTGRVCSLSNVSVFSRFHPITPFPTFDPMW